MATRPYRGVASTDTRADEVVAVAAQRALAPALGQPRPAEPRDDVRGIPWRTHGGLEVPR